MVSLEVLPHLSMTPLSNMIARINQKISIKPAPAIAGAAALVVLPPFGPKRNKRIKTITMIRPITNLDFVSFSIVYLLHSGVFNEYYFFFFTAFLGLSISLYLPLETLLRISRRFSWSFLYSFSASL